MREVGGERLALRTGLLEQEWPRQNRTNDISGLLISKQTNQQRGLKSFVCFIWQLNGLRWGRNSQIIFTTTQIPKHRHTHTYLHIIKIIKIIAALSLTEKIHSITLESSLKVPCWFVKKPSLGYLCLALQPQRLLLSVLLGLCESSLLTGRVYVPHCTKLSSAFNNHVTSVFQIQEQNIS